MKKLIIAILIISGVIALGFFYIINKKNVTPTVNKELSYQSLLKKVRVSETEMPQFDSCMVRAVEQCSNELVEPRLNKNHVTEVCEDYISNESKQHCLDSFAVEAAKDANDWKLCSKISDSSARFSCEIDIVSREAINKRSVQPCFLMVDDASKRSCLTNIIEVLAINQPQLYSICAQADSATDRELCNNMIDVYKQEQKNAETGIGVPGIPVPSNLGASSTSNKAMILQ